MKDATGLLLDITYTGGKKKYLLTNEKTIIGRMPECDIFLVENGVTRNHAQVQLEGET
jgi:pSer/pThr/pTyr-binding forkhead associated (FHA) protein